MARLRLALCQLDQTVGDLHGNVANIIDALASAEKAGADLAAFPELAITGYPPEDLLLKPAFIEDNLRALDAAASKIGSCRALIGFVDRVDPLAVQGGVAATSSGRRGLHNAVALCGDGMILAKYHKRLLPNYGVFDEERWFAPGAEPLEAHLIGEVRIGLAICEDLWFDEGPVASYAESGVQLVVGVNASPFSVGRRHERLAAIRDRIEGTSCTVAYVNQVGGQDELIFDGGSLVVGPDGIVIAESAPFVEETLIVDLEFQDRPGRSSSTVTGKTPAGRSPGALSERDAPAEIYQALVLGTRDYLHKNGFTDAVIGLSGGIDSSLVAVVAVDALGAEHVHGVAMPSRYSSEGSVADAQDLARRLGIDLRVAPIEEVHRGFENTLSPLLGGEPEGLTDENLQSRLRGITLMAISNAFGWIVLTTGNKSEMAVGYSTLYGDSAGGFAVIKDVLKTMVYQLCEYRNTQLPKNVIPESVIEKPPSAELRPDQRDDQSLPPYEELDPILEGLVERDLSVGELVEEGHDPKNVARIARLVDLAEYKRRQSPPGVRITTKAFGKDRRVPITNRYSDRALTKSDGLAGESADGGA